MAPGDLAPSPPAKGEEHGLYPGTYTRAGHDLSPPPYFPVPSPLHAWGSPTQWPAPRGPGGGGGRTGSATVRGDLPPVNDYTTCLQQQYKRAGCRPAPALAVLEHLNCHESLFEVFPDCPPFPSSAFRPPQGSGIFLPPVVPYLARTLPPTPGGTRSDFGWHVFGSWSRLRRAGRPACTEIFLSEIGAHAVAIPCKLPLARSAKGYRHICTRFDVIEGARSRP